MQDPSVGRKFGWLEKEIRELKDDKRKCVELLERWMECHTKSIFTLPESVNKQMIQLAEDTDKLLEDTHNLLNEMKA